MDVTDSFLYITQPVRKGQSRSLRMGSPVRVVYIGEDKLYGFMTEVTDEVQDNILLYQLPIPSAVEQVQRRRFVRIPLTIDIRYVPLKEGERMLDEELYIEDLERYYSDRIRKGLTVDLSGQGIGIVTREAYGVDQGMIVIIEHPKLVMAVQGRIRRVFSNPEQGNYRLGVEFTQIGNRQKEKIIQFVFEKMRAQMKMRVRK